jgi:hypothetical protein
VGDRHFPGALGQRDALPAVRDRHVARGGVHGPRPGGGEQHQPHGVPEAV